MVFFSFYSGSWRVNYTKNRRARAPEKLRLRFFEKFGIIIIVN